VHKQRVRPLVQQCTSGGCPNVWTVVGDPGVVIVQGFVVASWPRLGLAQSDVVVTIPIEVYLSAVDSQRFDPVPPARPGNAGVWTVDGDLGRVFVRGAVVRRVSGITVSRGESLAKIPMLVFREAADRLRSVVATSGWPR
jgi:hypothetical protein